MLSSWWGLLHGAPEHLGLQAHTDGPWDRNREQTTWSKRGPQTAGIEPGGSERVARAAGTTTPKNFALLFSVEKTPEGAVSQAQAG